jgi:hypothetical protein
MISSSMSAAAIVVTGTYFALPDAASAVEEGDPGLAGRRHRGAGLSG